MVFDYAVVGGGPGGVAFSLLMARSGRSVALMDEHDQLGGCHRVKRPRGVHTEHGPKVYMGASPLFFALASELSGKGREALFADYEHTIFSAQVNRAVSKRLTLGDKLSIASALARFMAGGTQGPRTVLEFMVDGGFGAGAASAVDGLCRLLDGGGADVTLMDSFLESIDSGFFQKLYVAAVELDEEVWKPAEAVLRDAGVELMLGTRAERVRRAAIETAGGGEVLCHRAVIAVPPEAAARIEGCAEELGMPAGFAERTRYRNYISATVDFPGELPNVWGHPAHPWSEITLNHGAYSGLGRGRVLISVNDLDSPDSRGVTANSLETRADLERALKEIVESKYGGARADLCVLSPTVSRAADGSGWRESDVAWLLTREGWFGHGKSDWLFACGHHSGQGRIRLNTCESAVQNAHALARRLEGVGRAPAEPFRLRDAILSAALVVLAALAFACSR